MEQVMVPKDLGYDKSILGLPVVLQPGQRLYIDGYFVAQKVTPARATLTTVAMRLQR
jgi:hypothetical protein